MRNLVRSMALLLSVLGTVNAHAAETQTNTNTAPAAVSEQVSLVNLNTADVQTLDRELKGVGPAKAQAIVAYRTEHGPFEVVDELLEVKGIGPAILQDNKSRLSLK
ncbi:ComEA family DNA-binding protein [Atopomonas sediminilitoris]|uniref:ComEA family DNA-binding protein n=1 Tax=Atopomonas sediminilitoris TaxID=2919919 RepID=UPI001F4E0237|nr:ComEA family DNA-binding protein [Atopomonas sediminilitoris]MCJ8169115.1 ComEA family DNA-binding protein [Atopomonas sediminilitoris]